MPPPPDPCPPDYYMTTADEIAGPRHRKIALNGSPMPDEKPHHEEETEQAKEETYIDALNLRLNHSVTDVYIPLPGGDLALSVRRNVTEESWNNTNGLTPDIRPDLPFGMGWSSNICPNVHLVSQQRGIDDDPCLLLSPTYAYVTDENGQTYRFILLSPPGSVDGIFVAMPTTTVDQDSYTCTLTGAGGAYTFRKRHGIEIRLMPSGISVTLIGDRNHPERKSSLETHTWSRVVSVTDRFGGSLVYGASAGLVPSSITANPDSSGLGAQTVGIFTDGRRVFGVQDPAGNGWSYNYDELGWGTVFAPILTSVGAPVMTTPTGPQYPVTGYRYSILPEADSQITEPPADPPLEHYHVNVESIVDPLGNGYAFEYLFDWSKRRLDPKTGLTYTVNGEPRWVSRVTQPDGSHASFLGIGVLSILEGVAAGSRATQVIDADGNGRLYDFGPCQIEIMFSWAGMLWPSTDTRRIPVLVFYPQMIVTYYSGSSISIDVATDGGAITHTGTGDTVQIWREVFGFARDAGMALASVSDLNGNLTTYSHTEPFIPTQPVGVEIFGFWSDPTTETRQWNYGGTTTTVTKEFHYGAYRIMDRSLDEEGRETVYELDSIGRRISESITPPGASDPIQVTLFAYESSIGGFLTRHTVQKLSTASGDPTWVDDLVKAYVPDASGRVAQEIVDPDRTGHTGLKLTTIHVYDQNGNKRSTCDPNGRYKWFVYDGQNRITMIVDEGPGTKSFQYDLRGNKLVETDENSHSTNFEYDTFNRVITQTRVMTGGSNLVTRFTYNRLGSRTQIQDPNGNVTVMAYDGLQRLIQTTDAAGKITLFEYDPADNPGASAFDTSSFKPTKITDPRGVVTQMHYDSLYRLREKSVEYASGALSTVQTNTDKVGNIIEEIDPLGHSVEKSYDALNRLTLTTWFNNDPANPSGPLIASTEQHFYTSTGLAHRVIDELGNATDSVYDAAGRATQLIGPAVHNGTGGLVRPVHQTHYDANGNVAATIDPRGFETDFTYDVRNRKTLETRPEVFDAISSMNRRPQLSWIYDGVGKVIAAYDERSNRTDFTFDAANRQIQVQAPSVLYGPTGGSSARPTTVTAYDLNGNVLQVTDPNGNHTVNTYDALNRLLTTTNGAGCTVTYTYDEVGNRLTVRDGLLQTTAMAYDGLNRLTTTTDPAGKVTTLTYDALNKISRTDAAGQVTHYAYNARNRLAQTTHVGRAVDDQTFTYDFMGKLLTVSEPGKSGQADVGYTYDALHRVSTETSGGLTHTYLYDLSDNRVKVTYGGTSRVVVSIYDAINRLTDLYESGEPTAAYRYDLHGNLVQKTHANGENVNETHDALNRVTGMDGQRPDFGGRLYQYLYRYDLAGNVVFVHEDYGQPMPETYREITQTYDGAHRLTLEQYRDDTGGTPADHGGNRDVTHVYDAADNRTSKTVHYLTDSGPDDTETFAYNSLNQLTQLVISKPARFGQPAVSQTNTYSYDFNGNRATRTEGAISTAYAYDYDQRLLSVATDDQPTYAYTYDYRTRRVLTSTDPGGGGSVSNTAICFSGGTSVQEHTNGTLDVEYIRGSDMGGGIGGILYTLRGGTPSYTHYNSRGDVVAKTDGDSALTYQAAYEAFGTRPDEVGSTSDKQKANTKDEDPTGLLNEGFRYRDLEAGVFITRDPIDFNDGPNLYTYVHQNPWTHFDPEGLASEDDYKKDQQRATEWHTQATKEAGGDKAKQKSIDDTYNKWMAADQKGINNIEATAKKWNDAAKKDVMKAMGLNWNTIDDKDYGFQTLQKTDPKAFIMDVIFGAGRIASAMKSNPKLLQDLMAAASKNGVSPNMILSIISMEQRGYFNGPVPLEVKQIAADAKKGDMNKVSVGPAQLKGDARAAAGLTVDQAKTFGGAFQGAGAWLSDKNPGIHPGDSEAQRARVYNNSYGYGAEYQAVRSQLWP
ncbi:MAG: RHS repeat-associated core domain-containing protein [Chthoniobacter sp.]|nr:RHS repeat-associated core domain-containing protein [Chthoniobacter sp.]